ncbi:hypothetical protein BUALT_Bualt06G0017500 [Buddleja alternifolia]|uniref:Uncharacterized protein n=1 Tax=Buddleja alternifolia TaxID=168488 RepID=A0AAV6XD88_9LAMI|nr:hypothetical protein BUALT_Bualt06G0017500 [Buddleja alternifolia]
MPLQLYIHSGADVVSTVGEDPMKRLHIYVASDAEAGLETEIGDLLGGQEHIVYCGRQKLEDPTTSGHDGGEPEVVGTSGRDGGEPEVVGTSGRDGREPEVVGTSGRDGREPESPSNSGPGIVGPLSLVSKIVGGGIFLAAVWKIVLGASQNMKEARGTMKEWANKGCPPLVSLRTSLVSSIGKEGIG